MSVQINPEKFQESITKELEVVKGRVRNLIGSAHWGEEGRYKEAVLMNVIRRFLPSNLSVGTGFITKSMVSQIENNVLEISRQIDIIVYDNRTPVLFSEGDFIITTQKNVKAIIEVKTRVRNSQLRSILATSIENAKLSENSIFGGIFAFEYEYRNKRDSLDNLRTILEELGENGKYVDHMSLGPYIFVKHWTSEAPVDSNNCSSDFYGVYDFQMQRRRAKKLSFSYFISNLVYSVSQQKLSDRLWLLFPISGGKEQYRTRTACLDN